MPGVYERLLRLYPPAYRQRFESEMIAVFREVDADAHKKGSLARAGFYLREVTGLLRGAINEHARQIPGRHLLFQMPFGRFTMRSNFRFPKTTVFLMTVILAGVVLAIEKAEDISASLPYANPPVGPIQPAPHTALMTMALMFVLVYVMGAVGGAIYFALRRAGAHG
ncbi:MAG: hypothetical protein ACLQLC_13215 [Candidatus Sulfotelmatobacter sp.]